jgi:trehalose 6-phosphate phosphatase
MSNEPVTAPESLADPAVVEACLDVLRQRPAALVTDIDGTISPIAPTPFEAVVHTDALQALEQLTELLDSVAVVSGRAPTDGAAMVGLDQLTYVGNHGLERIVRGTPWTHPVAEAARPAIAAALEEIQAGVLAAGEAPWLLIENKGVTGTVHYRLAEDPEAAAALLEPLAAVAAERHGLRVLPGRMIVELRPALSLNKGTAIRDLVSELELRGVVFFGDDVTDVDGFKALRTLRDEGQTATLNVGVLSAETPQIVAENVDLHVYGVAACAATLLAIATRLRALPPLPT